MLCLVANDEETGANPIGRMVSRRLKAVARQKKLTVGQVFYHMQNAVPSEELPSLKTVEAFLRGSQVKPTFDVVYAVARGLGVTLDQLMGVAPMPEQAQIPLEDDVSSRVDQLEAELREMRLGFAQFLHGEAADDRRSAEAIEQNRQSAPPALGDESRQGRSQRAK